MIPLGFVRATKSRPCPVCAKTDWCLVAIDGDRAICARIHSRQRFGKNAGWLHVLRADTAAADKLPEWSAARRAELAAARAQESAVEAKARALLPAHSRRFAAALTLPMVEDLARRLDLNAGVLRELETGWMDELMPLRSGKSVHVRAWTFPMRDALGNVIGIRTRSIDGEKRSCSFSQNGLFIPEGINSIVGDASVIFAPEGPTSCAAMRLIGLRAVGRPNNTIGADLLADYCRRIRPCRVVIVGDNDAKPDGSWPGKQGARSVAHELIQRGVRNVDWGMPPEGFKDMRDWCAMRPSREAVTAFFRANLMRGCA